MSIVGIFSRSQPSINGLVFDAVLSESSELNTEFTKFPIENGLEGSDHAVQYPLSIRLTVAASDNFFRSLANVAGGASSAMSATIGAATGKLLTAAGKQTVAAGLLSSVANASYIAGQSSTRSQSMLEAVRDLQRTGAVFTVVGAKSTYQNCAIESTKQEVTKENEQGLELVIDITQPLILNSRIQKDEIPAPNDTAELQAQDIVDLGQLTPQI